MLNTFVETFSNKDGLNNTCDCRFLTSLPKIAGFYGTFVPFPSYNFELRLWFCTYIHIMLGFMFAFIKPYKSTYVNVSMSFQTTVIVFMMTLWFEGQVRQSSCVFVNIFPLLPHIVAAITVMYKFMILIPCIKSRVELAHRTWLSLVHRTPNNGVSFSDIPHRLEDSNAYQTLQ